MFYHFGIRIYPVAFHAPTMTEFIIKESMILREGFLMEFVITQEMLKNVAAADDHTSIP
jgi:hypothetical protein